MPDAPAAPTTTISSSNVVVDWNAPSDRGSPILGYTIYIRTSDNVTFVQDQTNCNGNNNVIASGTQCSIPILVLRSSSY